MFSFSKDELPSIAKLLWNNLQSYKVWALHGEMGAGKTTLVHALCTYLKVASVVNSPTFAIINEYESLVAGLIYHMDWYRLKNEEEAIQAGVEDVLLSNHYCFIEWPEKAPGLLSNNMAHLFIQTIDENQRQIFIKTPDSA